MDADVAPRSKGCTVYSFGIRDSWNFEEDMEDMGCEVSEAMCDELDVTCW